jgi:hypothetical protein
MQLDALKEVDPGTRTYTFGLGVGLRINFQ